MRSGLVAFRIPKELKAELDASAKRSDLTRSDLIRKLVVQHVRKIQKIKRLKSLG